MKYFLLVFALAIPFWLVGGYKLPLPVNLPVSALSTFCPLIAAAILSYRQYGANGVKELLKKTWDFRKIRNKIWYAPALCLAPLIYLLSYAVMRLTGMPLPNPDIPWLLAPVFFVVYFIFDTGEELGWTAYVLDPLQNRWGAVKASLFLGIVWALWHAIPFVQTHNTASWIIWQSIKTVAMRMVIVWLYNRSGKSVFAAILYHTADNVSWSLFPNLGSHYNPLVTGVITGLVAIIVTLVWGRKTTAQVRQARVSGG